MAKPLAVLIVEDSDSDAQLIVRLLAKAGYTLTYEKVETAEQMRQALKQQTWEVVISDFSMPELDGNAALKILQESGLDIPFIVVSGTMGEDTAVAMMKAGAHDYLMKGKLARLVPAVERELLQAEERRERKKAEQALGESEVKFSQTFELSPIGIVLVGLDKRFIICNFAFSQSLGYGTEELVGKLIDDVTFPEDSQIGMDEMIAIVKGEITKAQVHKRYIRKDGQVIWGEVTISLIKDSKGRAQYFLVIIQDVTEYKQAERYIKDIISNNPMSIQVLDKDGFTLETNPAFRLLFGSVPPSGYSIFNDPQLAQKGMRAIFDQLRNGEVIHLPDTKFNPHDSISELPDVPAWVRTIGFPIFDNNNMPIRFILMHEDITTRKQAEEALQSSKQILEGIINAIPVRVFWKDKNLVYLGCNEVFTRDAGFSEPKDIIGKDDFQMGWRDQAEMYRKDDRQVIEGGASKLLLEEPQTTPDGNTITLLTSKVPLRSPTGEITGLIGTYLDITERKQAEEELRQSHEMITKLTAMVPGVVYQFRSWPDGRSAFPFASPGINDIYEVTPEEVREDATPVYGRLHPDDYDRIVESIAESARNLSPFHCEFRVILPRQGLRWRLSDALPERMEDGSTLWYGIISDISERKLAEEILMRERRDFQTIIDTAPVMVAYKGKDDHFIKVNSAFADFVGLTPEQIIGKTTSELVKQPEVARLGRDSDLEVMKSGKPILNQMIKWSGFSSKKEIWATFSKLPFKDADGNIIGTVSFINDVDDRVQAENALRDSEERFRALIENSSDAITLLNADGETIYDSPAAPGMLGYGPEDWIGKNVFELLHPDDSTRILELYQSLVRIPENRISSVFRVRHKNGSWIWLEMVATNLLSKASVKAIVLNYRDISGSIHAEQRIQKQLEHLTSLSAIDRVISTNFDLNVSLSEILTHVTKELEVDAADILLLDPISDMLEYTARLGFTSKTVKRTHLRLGESHAGRAALERKLIHIPNLKTESVSPLLAAIAAEDDFTCYFGVPLINKGKVRGVLEVFHREPLEPDAEWFEFLNSLAGQAAIAIENASLYESQQRTYQELTLAYDATIEGWSHAMDLRDKETEGHTQRVTDLTLKLARAFELTDEQLIQVRWGALLHDIGKMGVPDGILLKTGPLTDEEWVMMRKHPTFAYEMLSPIHYLRRALDIPYYHHEKWDGTGYPQGLKGKQIPLSARIFAVVDVWDALRSDRPYRSPWPDEKVYEHIRSLSGSHFDPQVVEAFLKLPR